ncbi:MAG TPA: DUF3159 domain-containing protein [Microbacteriaceae bacterium]|nr:DUF3159 domain-containing protein [Microbacteriaceae bacterium]
MTLREPQGGATDNSAQRRGLGAVAPGEAPSRAALLAALGGVRGLIESILPGLVFLVVYVITKSPWLSAIAPLIVSVAFVAVRAMQRGPLMSALGGLLLVGISAAAVLLTGSANENFLPGLWINAVLLVVTLVTLAVRWPLVGVIVGALTGDLSGWRKHRRMRRGATAATWIWAGLFGARLAAELPLYLTEQTETLAVVKLVMGIPLYAAVLWLSWLLLRRPKAPKAPEAVPDPDSDPSEEN